MNKVYGYRDYSAEFQDIYDELMTNTPQDIDGCVDFLVSMADKLKDMAAEMDKIRIIGGGR